MIEIIEGVAYLKNIQKPDQSYLMFEYLKNHTNQKLYLIEGNNKYGCGAKGELIKLDYMPPELVENGVCINPFYIDSKLTNENIDTIENPIQPPNDEYYKNKIEELEYALDNAIKERDMLTTAYDDLNSDKSFLENRISELSNKLECNMKEHTELVARLNDEYTSDKKVDKQDIRGLCKALYDLGFDVNLDFVDNKE